jgi:predicted esterase
MTRRLTLLLLLSGAVLRADELKRGEIVDGNITPSNGAISYAYYLPRDYTPDRAWPVLYVFDPRQRGAFAAGLFRDAAEEFGWILVSSNNTRSDSNTEMNVPALEATLPAARQRFAIDSRREYAAGFSGTAILAWALAATSNELAGIIGCSGRPIEGSGYRIPFLWFGAAGNRDFNYLDTLEIERGLTAAKGAHQLEVFDGAHRWAPPEVLRRGIEWMEIEAMKRGSRGRDDAIMERAHRLQIELARTDGDPLASLRRYEAVIRTFEGLLDVSGARKAESELLASKQFARARDEAARAEQLERAQLRRLGPVFGELLRRDDPPQAPAIAHALDVPRLKKLAAQGSYGGLAAQRVLEAIYVQLNFYLPQQLSGQKLLVARSVAQMIHPAK